MAIHAPNSTEAPKNGGNGATAGTPDGPLDLLLHVDDAQTVGLLLQIPSGRTRDNHALTALRIGAVALEQARGRIDSDVIRRDGDRRPSPSTWVPPGARRRATAPPPGPWRTPCPRA